MSYIDYLYHTFPLEGNTCPVCGNKTWMVLKCHECGKVFCRYCKPEWFHTDEEGDVEVTCECGTSVLFIED